MSVPTALYRLFGDGDVLLYIGISKTFGHRWHQHAQSKPWWPDVRRQMIDWHPSRDAAEAAEKAAIRTEHPKYNLAHNVPLQAQRPRLVALPPPMPSPNGLIGHREWTNRAAALGLTEKQCDRLPVTITLDEAARVLGLDRDKAYALARAGEFPCKVFPDGKQYRVSIFAFLRISGMEFSVPKLRSLLVPRLALERAAA